MLLALYPAWSVSTPEGQVITVQHDSNSVVSSTYSCVGDSKYTVGSLVVSGLDSRSVTNTIIVGNADSLAVVTLSKVSYNDTRVELMTLGTSLVDTKYSNYNHTNYIQDVSVLVLNLVSSIHYSSLVSKSGISVLCDTIVFADTLSSTVLDTKNMVSVGMVGYLDVLGKVSNFTHTYLDAQSVTRTSVKYQGDLISEVSILLSRIEDLEAKIHTSNYTVTNDSRTVTTTTAQHFVDSQLTVAVVLGMVVDAILDVNKTISANYDTSLYNNSALIKTYDTIFRLKILSIPNIQWGFTESSVDFGAVTQTIGFDDVAINVGLVTTETGILELSSVCVTYPLKEVEIDYTYGVTRA